MSIELILTTFEDRQTTQKHSALWELLSDSLRAIVGKLGGTEEDVCVAGEEILVHLPGGTAVIHSDNATFPIDKLDPLTLGVLYTVAKTADMVILIEGGDYFAILTSASQRKRLPEEDQTPASSPVCRSSGQLGKLLNSWFLTHSEFRRRAIAEAVEQLPDQNSVKQPSLNDSDLDSNSDWEAEHPLVPMKMQGYSGPQPVTFKYDPWVGDHVAAGPESVFINLHRFDPTGNGIGRHPEILRDLKNVCERYGQENSDELRKLIDIETEWPPLELRMQFFVTNIWPDRAFFNTYQLNDSIAAFMLEIARTGDMSFVSPGGVILVDPSQADRLPQTWKQQFRIVICQSSGELKFWLKRLAIDWTSGIDDGFKHSFDDGPTGTFPTPMLRHIYIECQPKETRAKQQGKLFRYQSQLRPQAGMMGGESWRLETPTGERFHAYNYNMGWLPFIREFAASEQRTLGSIVNFETFVHEDGRRFPLTECTIRKVDANEL